MAATTEGQFKQYVARGDCAAVVAAMRADAGEVRVQEWGCQAVRVMMRGKVKKKKEAMAAAGGVEAVVSALRAHGEENAAVAKFACGALGNLCQDTAANALAIAAAVSAGAAPVVQAAMRAHPCEIYLRSVFGPWLLAKLRSGHSCRDEQ